MDRAIKTLLLVALGLHFGCDGHKYKYVTKYTDVSWQSTTVHGKNLVFKAKAFFDSDPMDPDSSKSQVQSAESRFRYAQQHPERYGALASKEAFDREFGEATSAQTRFEVTVAGDYEARLEVNADQAILVWQNQETRSLESKAAGLSVGRSDGSGYRFVEGAPLSLRFPLVTQVRNTEAFLSESQIERKATPAADPIQLHLTVTDRTSNESRELTFEFKRTASHEGFKQSWWFNLYSAR